MRCPDPHFLPCVSALRYGELEQPSACRRRRRGHRSSTRQAPLPPGTARHRSRLLLALQLGGPRAEGPANGIDPRDEPLRVAFRPPKQTTAQAKAMDKVYADASAQSAAAKPWALSYMGSDAVRSRLDPSLQHYSNQQLLDMFTWEFQRLPLMHNAPLDSYGATLAADWGRCHGAELYDHRRDTQIYDVDDNGEPFNLAGQAATRGVEEQLHALLRRRFAK